MPADIRLSVGEPGGFERVMNLLAFDAFSSLAPAQLAVLAELADERFFPAGARIQEEDTPVREVHYLIEGEVECRRGGRRVRRLGPRSVVNGLAAFATVMRSHEVVALADTTTLSFTHEDQIDVFEDNFEILAGVLRSVAGALLDARAAAGPGGDVERAPAAQPILDHPLGLVEKITALRGAAPYDESRLEALAELARGSPEVRHAAGESLWSAGDESGWSLAIVSGRLVGSSDSTGEVHRFSAGSIPGALDSMAGRARGFDAMAETDVIGLRIEIGALLDVLEENTDMALDLLHSMAREVLALGERIDARTSQAEVDRR